MSARLGYIQLLVKIDSPSPSPSWQVLMRETWCMVEGNYADIKLVTERLMTPKVVV
jgi:hypothetical protein